MFLRLPVAIFVCSLLIGDPARAECWSYDGITTVQGILLQRTFPGPPNYESIQTGDRPETYWFVALDQPACVAADPKDQDGSPAVSSVERIQLVVTAEQYRAQANKVGRHVIVSGQLFGAISAHHKSPVLMSQVQFDP
jgi:Domain of unknown function (DUF4431)